MFTTTAPRTIARERTAARRNDHRPNTVRRRALDRAIVRETAAAVASVRRFVS